MLTETVALVAEKLNGPFKFQTVLIDEPRADEAWVEIQAVGICHAELSCLNGTIPVKFPNVFGHEGAGVVRKIGRDVQGFQPGDKVLTSYNHCGSCIQCRSRHPAYCMTMFQQNFGGTRGDGSVPMRTSDGSTLYSNYFGQSAFSRLAVVNVRSMVKVPSQTTLEVMAPLGCGMQTGAGAIFNTLNVPEGATVAIFGIGAVGASSIMAAKIRKASIIIAVDVIESRLNKAKTLGATHSFLSSFEVVDQIRATCQPNDGVEYAVDASGVTSVIEQMVDSLATRGRATSIGVPGPGKRAGVEVVAHVNKGREYVGCNQGDCIAREIIPYLIEQHSLGNYPFDELIKQYDIKDFETALEDMKSGVTIKPVLKWM
ncbi:hypothetical protein H2200_001496 [Cladophialophora chaetospira]|uniref:Enoyl reductase (ER) domain-containing protein n=1 Tax=Cladophialophora chaetospira TaxID=386627 RepID=A0AA38XL35_9EURO|nr:hypothetical protein H2200_001496 [Cladophialophora chaetospira]